MDCYTQTSISYIIHKQTSSHIKIHKRQHIIRILNDEQNKYLAVRALPAMQAE